MRGVVAAALGHPYVGIDLRAEQIAANREQWAEIEPAWQGDPAPPPPAPQWEVGDSSEVLARSGDPYDLVFSCPPYADLERYSDDPRDISTMDYPAFLKVYREIIRLACARLKPDRLAVWVVSEVRDVKGYCRGFVRDTIDAFAAADLRLYNEAVLVNSVGSLPLRVAKPFGRYRKLGRTHQCVLVFIKGDPRALPGALGDLSVTRDPLESEADVLRDDPTADEA